MKLKFILLLVVLLLGFIRVNAQSTCEDLIDLVKSESYGTTYSSYNSTAISKVTFYTLSVNYQSKYFAVVCFKSQYSYSCNEYIYQVGYQTQSNYAMNYLSSAGKAFWNYIEPYSGVLKCAPNFD